MNSKQPFTWKQGDYICFQLENKKILFIFSLCLILDFSKMFAYGIKDAKIMMSSQKNVCMVYTTLNCRVNSGQHLSLSNKGFTEGI